MIPNTVPEIAAYFDSDAGRFKLPVVAWDDQGRALVAEVGGTLVVANEEPDFDSLMGFVKKVRDGPRPSGEDGHKRKARAVIL